jgi:hypothetical protein
MHSIAGGIRKTRNLLQIILGGNKASKPHGPPTRNALKATFRKTSLQRIMVFVNNVPGLLRKILFACSAIIVFIQWKTVAAS